MKVQIFLILALAFAAIRCDDAATGAACIAVEDATKTKCNNVSEGNIKCCYSVVSVLNIDTKSCVAWPTNTVEWSTYWDSAKAAAELLDADFSIDCSAKSISVSMMFFALIALFFF